MAISNFDRTTLVKKGAWEIGDALRNFWSLKKGTRICDFCSNEPFRDILGPLVRYDASVMSPFIGFDLGNMRRRDQTLPKQHNAEPTQDLRGQETSLIRLLLLKVKFGKF